MILYQNQLVFKVKCLLTTAALLPLTTFAAFAADPANDAPVQKEPIPLSKPAAESPAVTSKEPAKKEPPMGPEHPLGQALISTFNSNPQLRSKVKEQYARAESVALANAGWRPSVSLSGSIARNWSDTESPPEKRGAILTTPKNAALQLKQNLYAGGATNFATEQAEFGVYAGFEDLAKTEQEVLLSALSAYLGVWLARESLALYQESEKLKKQNLEQILARGQVGELTPTDEEQAKADLSSAIQSRIGAEAELAAAVETYTQVVGEAPPEHLPLPPHIATWRDLPKTRHELEGLTLKQNPDVRRAEFAEKAAKLSIDIQEAKLAPQIDVSGSAQRNVTSGGSPFTSGRNNQAQIGVTVTIPIYQGGGEWAAIRKAQREAQQAKLDLVTVRRQAIQSSNSLYEQLMATKGSLEQLAVQINAGQQSVEGVREESLVGQRTLLDVLNEENKLLNTKLSLLKTKKAYLELECRVLALMGQMTAVALGLPVTPYPVKENYERVKDQWIGRIDDNIG